MYTEKLNVLNFKKVIEKSGSRVYLSTKASYVNKCGIRKAKIEKRIYRSTIFLKSCPVFVILYIDLRSA